MKVVLERLEQRTQEFARLPLFDFLRDSDIEPAKRLAFAPSVAHFVMSFADLYAYVLKVDPPSDRYQELVNAHAREDEDHWRWFLNDLEKLDLDPMLRFTDLLRFIWSTATVQTRMLTYRMCRLGYGASSLEKLVLVHAIEAAGKVTIDGVSAVGTEFAKQSGRKLVYLGHRHLASESDHTLEDADIHRGIKAIEVPASQVSGLLAIIDDSFDAFTRFAEEMLATAKAARRAGS